MARLVASFALLALAGATAASCSLGNVPHDDCKTDVECAAAFGLGSRCSEGFCSGAAACKVSSDCRPFGYMANCVAGACAPVALRPACHVEGPDDLVTSIQNQKGTGDAVLIGAVFDLSPNGPNDPTKEDARAAAAELAIDEINGQGGTQTFGLVVCDFDNSTGDFSDATDMGRYLANDVGVPVIIGPSSTQAVSDLATLLYQDDLTPTAIITPAATGVQLTSQPDHVPSSSPSGLLWRTTVDDTAQAQRLKLLVQPSLTMPTDRVGILYVDEQYGTSLEKELRSDIGDTLVRSFSFTGPSDVASAVSPLAVAASIKAVIVVSNQVDTARAVLDACSMQASLASLPFFLTDGSKDPAIGANPSAALAPILASFVGTGPKSSGNPSFFDRMQQKTGFDTSQFSFVPHSYDATFVAAYGIVYATQKAPGDVFSGADVAEGFSHLSKGTAVTFGNTTFKDGVTLLDQNGEMDVTGISGALDFDDNGDVMGTAADIDVWCFRNGRIGNGDAECAQ